MENLFVVSCFLLLITYVISSDEPLKNKMTIDINSKFNISGNAIDQSSLFKFLNKISKLMPQKSSNYDLTNEVKDKYDYPRSCFDLYVMGNVNSGLKVIYPYRNYPHIPQTVYCDQETDGGGWTVIQRRTSVGKMENFHRSWTEYRFGFGRRNESFWLGNELINEMTSIDLQRLRIDYEILEGHKKIGNYEYFHVDNNDKEFSLSVGEYTGNSGDIMLGHNGNKFYTKDRNFDINKRSDCRNV